MEFEKYLGIPTFARYFDNVQDSIYCTGEGVQMKTIELEFKGYWREVKKSGLEDKAGIYCVYAGSYDGEYVYPQRLLYIGKALSIKKRIGGNEHEHLSDWKCLYNSCYLRIIPINNLMNMRKILII